MSIKAYVLITSYLDFEAGVTKQWKYAQISC